MEININNKIFIGKYDENGILTIPLSNQDDTLYFQQWENQVSESFIKKKDYIKTFDYTHGYKKGTLFNCSPILSKNLDFVQLVLPCNLE
jgi:sulfur relay (sulfurtransferase) DsrF/TusC family protein